MIQRIEHLHAKLQFPLLVDWELFNQSQIQVPVTRRREDIAAGAVLARRRYAETGVRVRAAGVWLSGRGIDVNRLEEHRPWQRRALQVLQLGLSEYRHTRSSLVASI